MSKPTIHEVIALVAGHFGLSATAAIELMRTPTHPAGLRDDFAAAALNGLCANQRWDVSAQIDAAATTAYGVADAMLKARLP